MGRIEPKAAAAAIDKAFRDILAGVMPPDAFAERQRKWAEEDAERAAVENTLRKHCYDAIESMLGAMRSPINSRYEMEQALLSVNEALNAAWILDPKDRA